MTRRAGTFAIVLAAACGGNASGDKHVPAGSAKASDTMTVDTSSVIAASNATTSTMTPATPTTKPADSLAGLVPNVAVPAQRPLVVGTPTDTAPITATAEELASLAAEMIVPVQGVAASQLRDSYVEARSGHTHEALDIMAPRGTPVVSATDGRVLKLFTSVAGGTMIYAADATDRFILMYAHLDRYADGVVDQMPITRGQLLGYVGSTGNASAAAPHLHFAIARGRPGVAWWKGTPVNPYPLFVHPLAPDHGVLQTPSQSISPP